MATARPAGPGTRRAAWTWAWWGGLGGEADLRGKRRERSLARVRHILGGSAGNLVEWYDWYVYSAFTLYFAPRFFPPGDPTAQLLDAAAVFARRLPDAAARRPG